MKCKHCFLLFLAISSFCARAQNGVDKVPAVTPEQLQASAKMGQKVFPKSDQAPLQMQNRAKSGALLISKKSMTKNGSQYRTRTKPSRYCEGHPLATESLYVAGCSSFLLENDRTIVTAGHCQADDQQKLCDQYYIVFGVENGATTFNENQVFECDPKTAVLSHSVPEDQKKTYNLLTDYDATDHAILTLTKPVPSDVATPAKVAQGPRTQGDTLYVVGNPGRMGRHIQPFRLARTETVQEGDYKYLYSEKGMIIKGNSGGMVTNVAGEVVGIVASVDKKDSKVNRIDEFPLGLHKGQPCRYQAVESLTSEAVDVLSPAFQRDLQKALAQQTATAPVLRALDPEGRR